MERDAFGNADMYYIARQLEELTSAVQNQTRIQAAAALVAVTGAAQALTHKAFNGALVVLLSEVDPDGRTERREG